MYNNILEEELKNKVAADWFQKFDCTQIVGKIDFCVSVKKMQNSLFGDALLWAEAKTGDYDVPTMFVQLILTIGKARTFDKTLPPAFLGAFDFKKIAFVPYISIQDIFYLNDFNWNVTPSNHESKEFKLIYERVEKTLKQNTLVYDYEKDQKELRYFIANNITKATESAKIKIDKNNFIPIYLRWLDSVKPVIAVSWDELKKANILDSDFYLADLFVDDKDTQKIDDDSSIRDNLFVIFQNQGYKIAKENLKQMFDATINIRDREAYQLFWKRYKRPPIEAFQEYIIERRDLLVPQDIRERKGAFFTPRQWVELSQKYLTDVLGENWQDEYFIWDCAAGTGNLLAGLTNKYNIWASTLDQADVNVMHERIEHGANLLKTHVFQFDFLNDDFSKLPAGLQEIINDVEKRKKLVIYINPPYAEAGSTIKKKSKVGVSNETMVHKKYGSKIGTYAKRELSAQFLTRIYGEILTCKIAEFSKLKILQSTYFSDFRNYYRAKPEKVFLVPADTFDNVKGQFPIGFKIWNTEKQELFESVTVDVYNKTNNFIKTKTIISYSNQKFLNDWLRPTWNEKNGLMGYMACNSNDFQHQNEVVVQSNINNETSTFYKPITQDNLIQSCIYFAVRKVIPADWLNDRDQFLYPNDGWQSDTEFQNDCLCYTLFNNNIQSKYGINNWIPFTESEVNARDKFASNFMTDFIAGKRRSVLNTPNSNDLFANNEGILNTPLLFSAEAATVFDAGRELWRYYHSKLDVNVNAALYDIREYFQGRNDKGKMNATSNDEKYTALIAELRSSLRELARKIEPKVYEYGFLRE
jgi:hypothetical protein